VKALSATLHLQDNGRTEAVYHTGNLKNAEICEMMRRRRFWGEGGEGGEEDWR